ncbi:type III pantothenate kinase [Fodinibius salsisoli]|uniref:Type III pantothenate kinase n=1 Tax=Fodinibius salsisoli TaxID=2820877 RepID=A0ABT3PIJ2_9BACT|nr:type III pantothenate kinase [Fodinibius salsisoli]MCW9705756.1 type III pantothenate kinase [Fodinibius salsisoli]
MLLALDIGNTNIVAGVSDEGVWKYQWRIQSDDSKTADEYGVLLQNLFTAEGLSYKKFDRIIIGSVVPQLTEVISEVFRRRAQTEAVVLNSTLDTGVKITTTSPKAVGADLIAGVAGACEMFEDDCIVVDFGTATTLVAVKKPGELVGGAICAGLKVTIDALVGKAAQLSQIPLVPPPNVIGKNTQESMQSGLVLGHLCMVEGLIDRMKEQLDSPTVKVVATGGFSEKIGPYTDYFDTIDPMLTLDGLRIIMDRQE